MVLRSNALVARVWNCIIAMALVTERYVQVYKVTALVPDIGRHWKADLIAVSVGVHFLPSSHSLVPFFTITRIVAVVVMFYKKKKAFSSEIIPFLCISMHILETTWSFVVTSVDLIPIRYVRINQLPYAETPTVYVPPIHIAWAFLFIHT